MSILADDDVVVHGNPKRLGDINDCFGHLDGLLYVWVPGYILAMLGGGDRG